jgi:hypothetical protein
MDLTSMVVGGGIGYIVGKIIVIFSYKHGWTDKILDWMSRR